MGRRRNVFTDWRQNLGLTNRIHFLEGISDEQLQWFYAHCGALVAPSSTEGFGLPIAEALLAGCRVVCSDIPAFREVGGEHCRFVSLRGNAEESLADGIVATLADPGSATNIVTATLHVGAGGTVRRPLSPVARAASTHAKRYLLRVIAGNVREALLMSAIKRHATDRLRGGHHGGF